MEKIMDNFSLKIKNYKCFGTSEQGFEGVLPINLIIGRNNSGKSALLDLIHYASTREEFRSLDQQSNRWHKGQKPRIIMSAPLEVNILKRVFQENNFGGDIGGDHWRYGRKWIGKNLSWEIDENGENKFVNSEEIAGEKIKRQDLVVGAVTNPLKEKRFVL